MNHWMWYDEKEKHTHIHMKWVRQHEKEINHRHIKLMRTGRWVESIFSLKYFAKKLRDEK